MSRSQEPHRPSFPFGNPFRMIKPKGSHLSSSLLALVNSFEERLGQRMKKLMPSNKEDVLSLSWMQSAMELLCETHVDIKNLITDLELPVSDWDDKWIDVYLSNSVKLLDICTAFSSEISRLNQGNLMLQCALHYLGASSPVQYIKARSSLDGWRQHIGSKNPRVENCCAILESLIESLDMPKIKSSSKGKVLMRAMYGVKVETVFVCSVFASAFTGSSKKLTELHVPETPLWGEAFNSLQSRVNGEVQSIFSSGRMTALKEVEAVDESVKKLYPVIQDGIAPDETQVLLQTSISELDKKAEKLSQGLDILTKRVDDFFQIVLTGRDALLSNLRSTDSVFDSVIRNNLDVQLVR